MTTMDLKADSTHSPRLSRSVRLQSPEPDERRHGFSVSVLLVILGPALTWAAELRPDTLEAWNHYIEQAKARMDSRLDAKQQFLWVDEEPSRTQRVRSGEILVRPVNGSGRTEVVNGLIHDWIGAAFFPDTTIEKVFSTMNAYACYKDFYKPTVIGSKLLGCGYFRTTAKYTENQRVRII